MSSCVYIYFSSVEGCCLCHRQTTLQAYLVLCGSMVHFCCVPGYSSNSLRETHVSFFTLPLKRKQLLKQWVHAIGRKNLPVNSHTRVCSDHFVKANGRLLRLDEVPSLGLLGSVGPKISRKPPKDRSLVPSKQTSKHTSLL